MNLQELVDNDEAFDIGCIVFHREGNVLYISRFYKDVDRYVDLMSNQKIVSVGRNKETNEMFAAFDGRFYNNQQFECLYFDGF